MDSRMSQELHTQILVVDDDEQTRWALCQILNKKGYKTVQSQDGEEAIRHLGEDRVEIAILDIRMPGISGLDVLSRVRDREISSSIIVLTGHASIDAAVEAMKLGACDYLTKPVDPDRLLLAVQKASELHDIRKRVKNLETIVKDSLPEPVFVAQSPSAKESLRMAETVAPSDMTVLLQGESGTGKDLLARIIHKRSSRRDGPFVVIDCGAISETLMESEVFGHEKGAYTGADARKIGKVESAEEGTLFLDEVGDLSPSGQQRFLRIIETHSFERLGSTESMSADIRIVAATNRDLKKDVDEGRFREDLFYRLNVFRIPLSPLRERPEDIPLLAQHFVERFAAEMKKDLKGWTPGVDEFLSRHSWPGNCRELRNVIERAVLLADDYIRMEHFPKEILQKEAEEEEEIDTLDLKRAKQFAADKVEHRLLIQVLQATGGNKAEAARRLKLNYKTLLEKLRRWNLDKGTP